MEDTLINTAYTLDYSERRNIYLSFSPVNDLSGKDERIGVVDDGGRGGRVHGRALNVHLEHIMMDLNTSRVVIQLLLRYNSS